MFESKLFRLFYLLDTRTRKQRLFLHHPCILERRWWNMCHEDHEDNLELIKYFYACLSQAGYIIEIYSIDA